MNVRLAVDEQPDIQDGVNERRTAWKRWQAGGQNQTFNAARLTVVQEEKGEAKDVLHPPNPH